MNFVHFRTERYGAFFGDFIASFNADAVKFRMPEKADVNADGHAGYQNVATAGAEERRFRLMQSDSVHKRANQIFGQFMLFEIRPGGSVDFTTGLADHELFFSKAERFSQIFDTFLLAGGILAADGECVAHDSGVTIDFWSQADHDHFA